MREGLVVGRVGNGPGIIACMSTGPSPPLRTCGLVTVALLPLLFLGLLTLVRGEQDFTLVAGTNVVQLGSNQPQVVSNVNVVLVNVPGGKPVLPGSNDAYPAQ